MSKKPSDDSMVDLDQIRELFDAPRVAALAERVDSIRAVSQAASPGTDDSSEEIEEFTL